MTSYATRRHSVVLGIHFAFLYIFRTLKKKTKLFYSPISSPRNDPASLFPTLPQLRMCSSAFGGFSSLICETTEPWVPVLSTSLFPLFSVAVNQALLLYSEYCILLLYTECCILLLCIDCCILLLYTECRSDARYHCLLQGLVGLKVMSIILNIQH